MIIRKILAAITLSALATAASAECGFKNTVPLKSLSAGFEAWKVVTDAMAECGNFTAELDQDFRKKQPDAFKVNPSLYNIGGVANSTLIPLRDAGTIRELDDLVERYGQGLSPNQLIKQNGKIVAIAMMVNAQHLMYREDIFQQLRIPEPKTYWDVLDAAEMIREAGIMEYPLGGTFKTGWNLGEEFINMYLGQGGSFTDRRNRPTINNAKGIASLNMLKLMTEYMDPEYLVSDSTYVQKQFQQGKIAIANLWASRAAAMDDPKESSVVGLVKMASAPMGPVRPASSLWWDGIVIAKNQSDREAEAAFRVAMEGIDRETIMANNDTAVWIVDGFRPGRLAEGAAATAANGAVPYPASKQLSIMHTALGNGIAAFLTGDKSARQALVDIEEEYRKAAKDAGLL